LIVLPKGSGIFSPSSVAIYFRLEKVNPMGTVPFLKDNSTDAYIVDSDTISDYLETKFGPGAEFERKQLGTVAECPQP
jgi:Glutathione S-transferase, N-terminal domain